MNEPADVDDAMNEPAPLGYAQRRALPLLGHGLEFLRRPLEFFAELHRQPEPIVQIKMGRKPAYVLTTPELILRVQRGKESHSVDKGPFFDTMRRVFGDGLVISREPKHLRHRRLMQPAFHRDNIASYVRVMQQEATAFIAGWQDGDRVEFDYEMRELSMRISAKSLFNSDIGAHVVAETQRSFPYLVGEIPKLTFLPWLTKVPLFNRQLDIAAQRLSNAIDQIVAEYRNSEQKYDDLVSMLLAAQFDDGSGLTDEELREEILAIYGASMETTAATISFIFFEMSRRPDIRSRIEREVAEALQGDLVTAENIRQLVYTERVVAESLRRYSPAWLITRGTIADVDLDGVVIPAGSTLLYSPHALHNDPHHFPNPERFDPDRWTMEYRKTVTRSGLYQPFGTGNRNCIGEAFAWFEIMTVVATMVPHLSLEPVGAKPMREVGRAALELNELPMIVHRRRPAAV